MEDRTVKETSVEGVQRRTTPKKYFVFCLKVTWSDGTVNLVYRRYSDFLYLQTILCQAFPDLLGKPKSKRKKFTPLPDTCMNIGETLFRRMEQVNYFLKEILAFEKVSQSKHIRSFLRPRAEDVLSNQQLPRKTSKGRGNISKTVRGRLDKFRKTKVVGKNISSPLVLEHFIVMEDYKKQAKSDINLKKGNTVDVIEKRECGWWLVEADGEVGWAPALFLEPADKMPGADISNVRKFPIGKGEVYVATKKYVAVEDDELTFDIGVNLQILEKNCDGWWKASYLGIEGWVPQMYLKKLGDVDRSSNYQRHASARIFSTNQLRSAVEEEEVKEMPGHKAVDDPNLKLHEPDEGSSSGSPCLHTQETRPKVSFSEPVRKSPRPELKHHAVSDVVVALTSVFRDPGVNHKGTKDNMELGNARSPKSKDDLKLENSSKVIQKLDDCSKPTMESTILDSTKAETPGISPPTPNTRGTHPRSKIPQSPENGLGNIHSIPKCGFGKKLIRQNSLEIDTAQELNQGIQFWSTSEESEEKEEEEDQEQYEEYEDDENGPSMFCQVIEDYEADEDNEEIDLHEGEIMQIVRSNESGWWCVQNSAGEIGWAPSNFLKVLEEDAEDIE